MLQALLSGIKALFAAILSFFGRLFSPSVELTGTPGKVEAKMGLEVVLHGLSSAGLNGSRGTIASAAANEKGRWQVSIPQDSGKRDIALKPNNLIWLGREVRLCNDACSAEFSQCNGVIKSEDPDNEGKWTVEAVKTMNLKAANMNADGEIKCGTSITVHGLQSSACYNDLPGIVKAQCQHDQSRWEVQVSKRLSVPLQSLEMVWASSIFGNTILTKSGTKQTDDAVKHKRAVLIYFSAHWCPPCKAFTPVLADAYKKAASSIEIIFVSSDRDSASFESYYNEMPWAAVPFSETNLRGGLSSKFGVRGIPMLVALRGADGTVASPNARAEVQGMGDLTKCLDAWGC